MKYGRSPKVISTVDLDLDEYMYIQYMPIKMPYTGYRLPYNLRFLETLLGEMLCDDVHENQYVYATVKHMYVGTGCAANRMGWHSDGFGTDDINYIWYDKTPTEFCIQDFMLHDDHEMSMKEMENQASVKNIVTYPNKTLLRLDQSVIHRVAETKEDGFRRFIKISISEDQYNLKGNAHNYQFYYDWEMVERSVIRNHPIYNNSDFYKI